MLRQWPKLSRELWVPPPYRCARLGWVGPWANWIGWGPPCHCRGWDQTDFPSHSIILWLILQVNTMGYCCNIASGKCEMNCWNELGLEEIVKGWWIFFFSFWMDFWVLWKLQFIKLCPNTLTSQRSLKSKVCKTWPLFMEYNIGNLDMFLV